MIIKTCLTTYFAQSAPTHLYNTNFVCVYLGRLISVQNLNISWVFCSSF
uniref:Uncharacterized protein n=1 Tax=Medicago truncatula TaxID=3880 RepID=B7FL65_MEDTR|nr:unknown [Medicago truncatula]